MGGFRRRLGPLTVFPAEKGGLWYSFAHTDSIRRGFPLRQEVESGESVCRAGWVRRSLVGAVGVRAPGSFPGPRNRVHCPSPQPQSLEL